MIKFQGSEESVNYIIDNQFLANSEPVSDLHVYAV